MSTHPVKNIEERLGHFREIMRQARVDACIVPASDPHLSEYLPAHWQGRKWLSGFDGSAGTLVVCQDRAGLWTDSRYWVQARRQLSGSGIEMMEITSGNPLAYADWLVGQLAPGQRVAIDGQVIALAAFRQLAEKFQAAGITLEAEHDLLSAVWTDRPALPEAPVCEHDRQFVSLDRREKLGILRQKMAAAGASHHLVSTLDDIAWLLNLRGADIAFNPLFIAHLLVDARKACLFVDSKKLEAGLTERLLGDGIRLEAYGRVQDVLAALPVETSLLLDPRRVTAGMFHAVPHGVKVIEDINPSVLLKSRKAESEIRHIRDVMAQDGAAMCELFAWLEEASGKKEPVSELDVAEKSEAFRRERPGFVSLSFDTIAGFNENGALPHYRATPENHAVIDRPGLLLVDSGGQYPGGTTDITRVVAVGEPSAGQKRDFTLVLKSLIALGSASFPRSVRSAMLDAIARAPLWREGIDYGHGTGHGVGYFLNVHEGPQTISYHAAPDAASAMEEGMVTSIEPGIYRPGKWGVRLENLVVNRLAEKTAFGEYLCFETLTLCPFDLRCIERSLLDHAEIAWLNRYHAEVRYRLEPLLSERARAWMHSNTRPL